ncbi:MAG: hypothetical protein ACPGWR_17060 [Ardenticatenaceae bacterium]
MTSNIPSDLRYSKEDAHNYRELIEDDLSPFYGAKFKDIFLYAAAYGFRNGMRQNLIKGQANIPLSALSQQEIWLLKSIAIADSNSLDILNTPKQMYQIAEEYANGALNAIYLEVFGGKPKEPYRRMMDDVLSEFEMIEQAS